MRFIRCIKLALDLLLSIVLAMIAVITMLVARLRWVPVAATIGLLPAMQEAQAQTLPSNVWVVDQANGDDMNSGQDEWVNARETIQSVLGDINLASGDEIWVAQGTYKPTTAAGFSIPEGVGLYGGFPTGGAAFFQQDPYVNVTILDGDNIDGNGLVADHVVKVENTQDNRTWLDGFIIRNGDADGSEDDARGGGLLVIVSQQGTTILSVTRCRFFDNSAHDGGAVAVHRTQETSATLSNIRFTNCVFTENTAGAGGAVWVFGSEVQITNSLFVGNRNVHGECVDIVIADTGEVTLADTDAIVHEESTNPDRIGVTLEARVLLALLRSLTVAAR